MNNLHINAILSAARSEILQEAIKAAEEQLKSVSQQPGYGITVLKVRVCLVVVEGGS